MRAATATLTAAALLLVAGACAPALRGRALPARALSAEAADFRAGAGEVVLHYYGAGGWGILWREVYVLAAPYLSNHALVAYDLPWGVRPDVAALQRGFAGTPVERTRLVLVGHGHIDHAGDIPGFFDAGLPRTGVALAANRTTAHLLAPFALPFTCVDAVDWDAAGRPAERCPVPGVRVTPLASDHAPHVRLLGTSVQAYDGIVREPLAEPPSRGADWVAGYTLAWLVDLLDERGRVVFRIHYMDAAARPPNALVPAALLAERPVDLHIACVPGFDNTDEYPEAVVRHHRVRHVLLGHWEDFFVPRSQPLSLVTGLSADGLAAFTARVEAAIDPEAEPLRPRARPRGPHARRWTLPVPGETFRFAAD